jgi:hypothetical protein
MSDRYDDAATIDRLTTELAEVTGDSLHTVAKYWRERQALRTEVGQQATEIDRLNSAITRVLVLIAPETQMAQPLYGDRYFDEADIRAALEGS